MSKNLMNMKNARLPEQLERMKKLQKYNSCYFCGSAIEKYGGKKKIYKNKFWFVKENDYPYEGSKFHLLLVYKKHIDSIDKVSAEAMVELLKCIKWVNKKFKIPGGSFIMRFGNNKYTGATITHLHAHIVSGHKQRKNAESIKTYIGFKK